MINFDIKYISNKDINKYKDILQWANLLKDLNFEKESMVVAIDNQNNTIGYLLYYKNHIHKFEIKPELRNNNIGSILLESFCQISSFKYKFVSLNSLNVKSNRFYKRNGFINAKYKSKNSFIKYL